MPTKLKVQNEAILFVLTGFALTVFLAILALMADSLVYRWGWYLYVWGLLPQGSDWEFGLSLMSSISLAILLLLAIWVFWRLVQVAKRAYANQLLSQWADDWERKQAESSIGWLLYSCGSTGSVLFSLPVILSTSQPQSSWYWLLLIIPAITVVRVIFSMVYSRSMWHQAT